MQKKDESHLMRGHINYRDNYGGLMHIRIITRDGMVTSKGAVHSDEEKQTVEAKPRK
jgi:redox-sensitive bicupin YhaK (pirin superfamily)